MSIGILALDYALDYCGVGEVGGNNLGPWVKTFCGRDNVSWCAGFVGRCLEHATGELGKAPVKRSLGARTLGNNLKAYPGAFNIIDSTAIEPGDITVWKRTGPGTTPGSGHIGIAMKRVRYGFISIEGNVGSFASTRGIVRPIFHPFEEKNFLYAVRLP